MASLKMLARFYWLRWWSEAEIPAFIDEGRNEATEYRRANANHRELASFRCRRCLALFLTYRYESCAKRMPPLPVPPQHTNLKETI